MRARTMRTKGQLSTYEDREEGEKAGQKGGLNVRRFVLVERKDLTLWN